MRLASRLLIALLIPCLLVAVSSRADEKPAATKGQELEADFQKLDVLFANADWAVRTRRELAVVLDILAKAERIEVFRISGRTLPAEERGKKPAIRDHEIRERTTVVKAEARKEVVDFLGKVLHWNRLGEGDCWIPNHAVRASAVLAMRLLA